MAVTAQNLSDIFRAEVDDTVTPYLWSDIEVLGYIDEAQKAFARRTELFYDSVTPTITSIAIVAGAGTVALDPRDRKSTRLNSSHIPLSRMPSSA